MKKLNNKVIKDFFTKQLIKIVLKVHKNHQTHFKLKFLIKKNNILHVKVVQSQTFKKFKTHLQLRFNSLYFKVFSQSYD